MLKINLSENNEVIVYISENKFNESHLNQSVSKPIYQNKSLWKSDAVDTELWTNQQKVINNNIIDYLNN